MLNLTTALGRNGFQDWILQRISALILAIYSSFILIFWLLHPVHDFTVWQILFACAWMHYATILAILALAIHAWIGVWTILTDYIHNDWLRLILLVCVFCTLLFEVIWCGQILWGYY